MTQTSARSSDFPADMPAWQHTWLGKEQGWHATRVKPDAIMQSAGGLLSSPADMGRWLQLQLRGEGPGIPASAVAQAQASGVQQDAGKENPYGLPCHAYGLGWNLCRFKGHDLHIHGGTYPGSRSVMAFSRELGVGIAAFSNSDNQTGWLTNQTVQQFIEYLIDDPDAERNASARQVEYPRRVDAALAKRTAERNAILALPQWKGWSWKPDRDALQAYAGEFRTRDPRSEAKIEFEGDGLVVRVHHYAVPLSPASPDVLVGYETPLSPPDPLAFQRGKGDVVTGFTWRGERYCRVPPEGESALPCE
jgi:hypothetical protein